MDFRRVATCSLLGALLAAGCTGPSDDRRAAAVADTATGAHDTAGAHGAASGHAMDAAMMERHAAEGAAMADTVRAHLARLRAVAPDQLHHHVPEHVAKVSGMLTLMNRHMREMDMGMGMDDEHMGQMMGMSAEQHRRMMADMQALRLETERLQTASPAEVRQRMPDHLARVDSVLQWLDHISADRRT